MEVATRRGRKELRMDLIAEVNLTDLPWCVESLEDSVGDGRWSTECLKKKRLCKRVREYCGSIGLTSYSLTEHNINFKTDLLNIIY